MYYNLLLYTILYLVYTSLLNSNNISSQLASLGLPGMVGHGKAGQSKHQSTRIIQNTLKRSNNKDMWYGNERERKRDTQINREREFYVCHGTYIICYSENIARVKENQSFPPKNRIYDRFRSKNVLNRLNPWDYLPSNVCTMIFAESKLICEWVRNRMKDKQICRGASLLELRWLLYVIIIIKMFINISLE